MVENARPSLNSGIEHLESLALYTDNLPFGHFEGFFEVIPQLVNVVSLCEVIPYSTSRCGGKLPLDLHTIAAKCTNAYFAPRRFAAIQLAFSTPRSRVLIFRKSCPLSLCVHILTHFCFADTGRIVGTGCDSPQAARLAVVRAQRQLATEAGVYLKIRNFQVLHFPYPCALPFVTTGLHRVRSSIKWRQQTYLPGSTVMTLRKHIDLLHITTERALWDLRGDLSERVYVVRYTALENPISRVPLERTTFLQAGHEWCRNSTDIQTNRNV
jgi:hypothetical protein